MGLARDDLPDFGKTLAACDRNLPAAACLDWHIRPHLARTEIYRGDPAKGFGAGYSAPCPAHDDSHASFTVSVGRRSLWYQCHAGCDLIAVRAAMIRRGVPAACLPIPRERKADLVDQALAVLADTDLDHGHARMLATALLEGLPGLPRGGALEELAAKVGVSRSRAYDYGREGLQPTSGRYPSKQESVQEPSSGRHVAPQQKSDGRTKSDSRTTKTGSGTLESPIVGPPVESQLSPSKPRRRRAA